MDISKARCADCDRPMTVSRMLCPTCNLRLETEAPVRVQVEGLVTQGLVDEVRAGGLFVSCPTKAAPGAKVSIDFDAEYFSGFDEVKIEGTVRHGSRGRTCKRLEAAATIEQFVTKHRHLSLRNKLEFGKHGNRPNQIVHRLLARRRPQNTSGDPPLVRRRTSRQ